MSSNIFIVKGRLGANAEIKETSGGTKYLRFSLANSYRENGEDKTTWYDVTSYSSGIMENMSKYLTKGTLVEVNGELKCRLNIGKDGRQYLNLNVKAFNIDFVSTGKKNENNNDEQPEVSTYNTTPSEPKAVEQPKPEVKPQAPTVDQTVIQNDDEDGDLPF